MNDRNASHTAVVVNDDAIQLSVLVRLLKKTGFAARAFEDVASALAAMTATAPPDLIVTDLYMPGIDGWRFCRLLRSPEYAALNQVPILVISATYAGEHPERIAADLGVEAFLPMPISAKRFSEQVHAILEGRQARRLPRVLIVAGDPEQSKTLADAFDASGYRADTAVTAADAEAAFARAAYDVVALEHYLTDGAGDALLDAFHAQRPECVYLMMTADPSPSLALDWMKRGAAAYLCHPFEPGYLLELCERARRERSQLHTQNLLKQRTRALRKKTALLTQFQQMAQLGSWQVDWRANRWNWSDEVYRILGSEPQSSAADRDAFLGFVHPDDRYEVENAFADAARGGSDSHDLAYRIVRKDSGAIRYLRERCVHERDHAGAIVRSFGIVQDITEERRMERRLRVERDLARALGAAKSLENTLALCLDAALFVSEFDAGGVYLVDPQTGVIALRHHRGLSDAFVEATRRFDADSPEARLVETGQPLYTHHRDVDVPMDGPRADEALKALAIIPLQHHERVVGCLNIASRTEDEVPEHAREALGLLAAQMGQAVAETMAREVLRVSEERYRSLFNQSTEGIYLHDLDGRVLDVNELACAQSGYSREEWLGLTVFDGHPSNSPMNLSKDELSKNWRQWAPGQRFTIKAEHQRKDGTVYPVEISTGKVRYEDAYVILATVKDITKRKQAEEALRASEEMHRALIAALPDTVMRFDRDGRHLFVSDNVRAVADIEPTQFIGKTHAELGFPEDLCRFWEESIRQVFNSGAPVETEFTLEGKAGPVILNWRLVPELDARGAVVSALSISRDITARRRAEQRYQKLFGEMLDAFAVHEMVLDADGAAVDYRFLAVNPAFERMTGLAVDDIVGKTVREVLPETEAYWIDRYGRVARTGESLEFENYSAALDKYFEVRAFRPAPNQFACTFVDITARRQAEAKLRLQSLVLDQIEDRVTVTDLDGIIAYVNQAEVRALGYARETIIGASVKQFGDNPELGATQQQIVEETLRHGAWRGDVVNKTADGREVLLDCRTLVVLDEQGERVALVGISTDITARRRAEDRLRRLTETLLGLGDDFDENLTRLTALCGETMGATCALYNRLEGEMLCALGQWNAPPDFEARDRPEGHVCFDVIRNAEDGLKVVENLSESIYADTDPNVRRYGLETYMGHPVHCRGRAVGAICAVFQEHVSCAPEDARFFGIIAAALGAQEERRLARVELAAREERFQRMLLVVPDMVSIHDMEMNIVYSNWKGFAAVSEEKRLLNTKCYKTYRDQDAVCPDCRAREVLSTKKAFSAEECLPNGQWIELRVIPIFDADGRLEYFVEWVRDITTHKEAEA